MFWKNTSFLKDMAYLTTMADKISFHRDHNVKGRGKRERREEKGVQEWGKWL